MPDDRLEVLQGTLDMLILQTLIFGKLHGHAIATTIGRSSADVLQIDHGSLYPALHRLERQGLIAAEWGVSDNNRRARFYKLTALGRKRLRTEASRWDQFVEAVARIMRPAPEEE